MGFCLFMETTTSATPGISEGLISRIFQLKPWSYPRVRRSAASTCCWLGSSMGAGVSRFVSALGEAVFEDEALAGFFVAVVWAASTDTAHNAATNVILIRSMFIYTSDF